MNDTLGIILAGIGDAPFGALKQHRSVAAMPICSRYRLVDFLLSSMVNSGITNVGIPTLSAYRSLMDHLGSGTDWDLDRKLYGLFILPPYGIYRQTDAFVGDVDVLAGITDYLSRSKQEYVLLCGCNALFNMTFYDLHEFHLDNNADITVLCCKQPATELSSSPRFIALRTDETGRVTDMRARDGLADNELRSLDVWFMKKSFLEQQIAYCSSRGMHDFAMDVVIKNLKRFKVYAHCYDGYVGNLDSINDYYRENMRLLERENFTALFRDDLPVYTKIKDQVPTRYTNSANVKNSLVGDGCTMAGTVENCVIFRGVTIEPGAVVRNSIIMQDTHIEAGANLDSVILDKNVTISAGKHLAGQSTYPIVVGKNTVI